MAQRGMGALGLMLALVLVPVAAIPAGAGAGSSPCAGLVGQDDAGSGGDAGDRQDGAVGVVLADDTYNASLGLPKADGLDTDDWYAADWGDEVTTATFSVDLTDATYPYGPAVPAPQVALEVWEPGAEEPTFVTAPGENAITFQTGTPGTWHFHVLLLGLDDEAACTSSATIPVASQNYMMYLGCDPHCSTSTS